MSKPIRWACGVTTVSSRASTTLPQTMHSLCDAGFEEVRLFVDGCDDPTPFNVFGCPITVRPSPPLRIVGNFMLALAELYVRDPRATRFAIFQDDVICLKNLRQFLTKSPYPKSGYLNLYTYPVNYQHIQGSKVPRGWYQSNQRGLGALGLVFDRDAMLALLGAGHMIRKPMDADNKRSWKALDGGIVSSMKNAGFREYVHTTSLVQHIGNGDSTLGNVRPQYQEPTPHFPGPQFDAMELL